MTSLFDAAAAYRDGEITRDQLEAGGELHSRGEIDAGQQAADSGVSLMLVAGAALAAIVVAREVA